MANLERELLQTLKEVIRELGHPECTYDLPPCWRCTVIRKAEKVMDQTPALQDALRQARESFNKLTSSDDPLWGGYKQEHLGDVDSIARQAMQSLDAVLKETQP